jgi:hypothetical protein
MSEIATVSTFRFWVVFFLMVTLAGEFFIFKYNVSNNPSYQWNLLVKEQENFKLIADKKDIERVIYVINGIDNFFKSALRRAYSGIEDWFKPLLQLIVVRGYMYKYMLPLFLIAVILGTVEGNIRYKIKTENFETISAFRFHWIIRFALAFKLTFIFGYIFSPFPVNPFLFIYGIPLITFFVMYILRANLPIEKI